jgi:hypothetical protein
VFALDTHIITGKLVIVHFLEDVFGDKVRNALIPAFTKAGSERKENEGRKRGRKRKEGREKREGKERNGRKEGRTRREGRKRKEGITLPATITTTALANTAAITYGRKLIMDPMTTERAPSWGSIFRDVACTFRTSSV